MKILITGGGGFIGKHLIKKLLENRNKITVFDNESNCSKKDVQFIKNVNFQKGDIRNYEVVKNITKNHDLIIHLAAKVSISDSAEHNNEMHEINVTGSLNIVKSCVENNISKIIVMSSAAVYGEGKKNILNDENTLVNPISAYGKSKLEMEKIIKEFSKNYNLNSIIFRLFNVYGEGQSDAYAGVIKKFISSAKNNMPIKIFGDGTQTRDFVCVEDVVELISNTIPKIEDQKATIYNIGSGKSITINELASIIFSIFKTKLNISYEKQILGDIKFSNSSIIKIENAFHYSPKWELEKKIKILSKTNLEETF